MRIGVAQRVDVVKDCTSESKVDITVNQSKICVCIQKIEVHVEDDVTSDSCELSDLPFKVNMGNKELSQEETEKVGNLFHKYKDCFCVDEDDLGSTETI